uniref:Uncharacterized protein n=1 Tax=Acrobeloides nanus TaxID=290746 RepID=A0A914EQ18_9BILA
MAMLAYHNFGSNAQCYDEECRTLGRLGHLVDPDSWSTGHLADRTVGRPDTWSTGQLIDRTLGRPDSWPTGQLVDSG